MKKPKTHQEYVWVIAYINLKHIPKVDKELSRFEDIERKIVGLEARIPTVRVLQKNFKKKAHYEEVPLLFNYGFFRIPKIMAYNPEFMAKLKSCVSCISGWVKDPVKNTKKTSIAQCTYEELLQLYQEAEEENLYSDREVESLTVGQEVILRGYPFEGIKAKILKVNKNRKEVEVEIATFGIFKSVKVQYENLLYTIYKGGYDDSLSNHVSLEELSDRKTIDRAFKNSNTYDE
jgi:transcription antitermination factor NusG